MAWSISLSYNIPNWFAIGLTEDHPTLTTYFEGEIIGSKYTFLTQHTDWGSTDKVDFRNKQERGTFTSRSWLNGRTYL